jgi:hypothetical protein
MIDTANLENHKISINKLLLVEGQEILRGHGLGNQKIKVKDVYLDKFIPSGNPLGSAFVASLKIHLEKKGIGSKIVARSFPLYLEVSSANPKTITGCSTSPLSALSCPDGHAKFVEPLLAHRQVRARLEVA